MYQLKIKYGMIAYPRQLLCELKQDAAYPRLIILRVEARRTCCLRRILAWLLCELKQDAHVSSEPKSKGYRSNQTHFIKPRLSR